MVAGEPTQAQLSKARDEKRGERIEVDESLIQADVEALSQRSHKIEIREFNQDLLEDVPKFLGIQLVVVIPVVCLEEPFRLRPNECSKQADEFVFENGYGKWSRHDLGHRRHEREVLFIRDEPVVILVCLFKDVLGSMIIDYHPKE